MKEWLVFITEQTVLVIDALALVIVVWGTAEAFVTITRVVLRVRSYSDRREIWLRYARWLVAALTFQLAADIIETSITTSWDVIARIGAIAVIRTFLNFFLERDVSDVRARRNVPNDVAQN